MRVNNHHGQNSYMQGHANASGGGTPQDREQARQAQTAGGGNAARSKSNGEQTGKCFSLHFLISNILIS